MLLPAAALAADALQDPDISVHQVVQQFPPTVLGSSSNPTPIIITNHSAVALPLGAMTLRGVNPAEFALGATTCGATLVPAASCTVEVGFKPTTPQQAAGCRIEPPVSVPNAPGHWPEATAAAEPPDDPPGVRVRSHGLRVT